MKCPDCDSELEAVETKEYGKPIIKYWCNVCGLYQDGPHPEDQPIPLKDICSEPLPELSFWLNPIIPKNALILIGGNAGSGKSITALSICLAMALGKQFLGRFHTGETKPRVLYYDLENGRRVFQRRVGYLTKEVPDNFDYFEGFDKEDLETELKRAVGYDVIVLDSYRRFLEGEENASEITDRFYRNFSKPLLEAGKTVIIIHHFRKRRQDEELTDEELLGLFRGSSDIVAQVDEAYALIKGPEEYDQGSQILRFRVSVYKAKNRLGLNLPNFAFSVEKNDQEMETTLKYEGEKRFMSAQEERLEKIKTFLGNDEKEIKEIVKLFPSLHIRTTERVLEYGLGSGELISDRKGYYRNPIFLQKDLSG